MPKPILEDRFLGCLLGLAVGDALGAHFEGQAAEHIRRRYPSVRSLIDDPPAGELWYTDDTQMMIGLTESLAESLIERGGVEEDSLCHRFAANYQAQRGYGRGAQLILEAIAGGRDHRHLAANHCPGGSFGNGAAMRVAPVGLLFRDDHDELWRQARLSALPTHVHPLGVEGAQVIALATSPEAPSDAIIPEQFCGALAERCSSLEFAGPLQRAARLSDARDLALFGAGIEATASVVTAVASFCLSPDSYSETIGRAVLLGGDTDTIAAMAGAISGAYLGPSGIPPHLLERLEDRRQGRAYIARLARDLYRVYPESEQN